MEPMFLLPINFYQVCLESYSIPQVNLTISLDSEPAQSYTSLAVMEENDMYNIIRINLTHQYKPAVAIGSVHKRPFPTSGMTFSSRVKIS